MTASRIATEQLIAGVSDESLVRPDGRTVAWTRIGKQGGIPVVRMPGTPGSRWSVRADRSIFARRRLDVITTERPGFGRSTRLPGRGFAEHADDIAAILDFLDLDRVLIIGASGGAAPLLAFASRHPDRVLAATVTVGISPYEDAEIDQMLELNARGCRLVRDGDEAGLRQLLNGPYEQLRRDPLAGLTVAMASAPDSDRTLMADPVWQAGTAHSIRDAFAPGIDGWVDETMAMFSPWTDIDLDAIRTSVTWWHGRSDRNTPMSAARRLIDRLPTATLRDLGEVGHLEPYLREGEILDELLSRQ